MKFLIFLVVSMGMYLPALQAQTNVALGKNVRLSKAYPLETGYEGAKVVDGNTDGNFANKHSACTDKHPNPWMEIDLGDVYNISAVTIYNRTDRVKHRLNNFTILAGMSPLDGNKGGTPIVKNAIKFNMPSKTFPTNQKARYVRLSLNANEYLTIAEIEVMGTPANGGGPTTPSGGGSTPPNSGNTTVTIKNTGSYKIAINREINGGASSELVQTLAGTAEITVPANIGGLFSFTLADKNAPGSYVTSNPQKVYKDGQYIKVFLGEPFVKGDPEIANISASEAGYDLITIDPLRINSSGKAQIFDKLENDDLDYRFLTDTDINSYVKNHFKGKGDPKGGSKLTTKVYRSKSGLKKGFSANIGIERSVKGSTKAIETAATGGTSKAAPTPMPEAEANAKASGSLSFEMSTEKNRYKDAIYSTLEQSRNLFQISLVESEIDFHKDFITAVTTLPVPTEIPDSVAQAKTLPGYNKYKDFIRKYGTHYAKSINYGGRIVVIKEVNEEQVDEMNSWGISVSGAVEASLEVEGTGGGGKGEVGAGYKETDSFTNFSKNSTVDEEYFGGQADYDMRSWALSPSNVTPNDIKLSRITDLIVGENFPAYPNINFDAIREMLGWAINDRVGNLQDDLSNRKRNFKLSEIKLIHKSGLSEEHLYGNITVNVIDSSGQVIKKEEVWSVRDVSSPGAKPGHYLKVTKGTNDPISFPKGNGGIVNQIKENHTAFTSWSEKDKIVIFADLYRWHPLGRTDSENEIGDAIGLPGIPKVISIKDLYGRKGKAQMNPITKSFSHSGFAQGECTIEFYFEEVDGNFEENRW